MQQLRYCGFRYTCKQQYRTSEFKNKFCSTLEQCFGHCTLHRFRKNTKLQRPTYLSVVSLSQDSSNGENSAQSPLLLPT